MTLHARGDQGARGRRASSSSAELGRVRRAARARSARSSRCRCCRRGRRRAGRSSTRVLRDARGSGSSRGCAAPGRSTACTCACTARWACTASADPESAADPRGAPVLGGAPIVVSHDLHANLTRARVEAADAIVAYQTNPHRDHASIGQKAGRIVIGTVLGEIKPRDGVAHAADDPRRRQDDRLPRADARGVPPHARAPRSGRGARGVDVHGPPVERRSGARLVDGRGHRQRRRRCGAARRRARRDVLGAPPRAAADVPDGERGDRAGAQGARCAASSAA